jgi:hypothetical protein
MSFAGINYSAVLVAAVVGSGFCAVWYMALARLGSTWLHVRADARPPRQGCRAMAVHDLVRRRSGDGVLAGLIGHVGAVTVKNGLISGAFAWLGFVITTLAVNNMFGLRSHKLIAIDGGHWLGVLLVMGAIIGAGGV